MAEISIIQLTSDDLQRIVSEAIHEEISQLPSKLGGSQEDYLTREQTADLLKISKPTLHTYTQKGTLQGYRLDGRVLYKRSEIEAALKPIPITKYRRV